MRKGAWPGTYWEKNCSECGKTILMVRTTTAAWMPCEPDLIKASQMEDKETLIRNNGHVIVLNKALEKDTPDIYKACEGYRPHWAFCTNPDKFRRDKMRERNNRYLERKKQHEQEIIQEEREKVLEQIEPEDDFEITEVP